MPILDYHHKILCADVWSSDEMVVRPQVRDSIEEQMKARFPRARGLFLVGDMTGHYYHEASDLDLLVAARDEDVNAYFEECRFVSGYLLDGTQHKVNFHVVDSSMSPAALAAKFGPVYDIGSGVWYGRRVLGITEMTRPEAVMEHISWRLYKAKNSTSLRPYKWDMLTAAFSQITDEDRKQVIYKLKLTVAALEKNVRSVIKAFNQADVWRGAAAFAEVLEESRNENEIEEQADALGLPEPVLAAIVNKYRYEDLLDQLELMDQKIAKQVKLEEEANYGAMYTASVVDNEMLSRFNEVASTLIASGGGHVNAVYAMADILGFLLRNNSYVATDTRRKMVIKKLTDSLFPRGMGKRSKTKEPEDEPDTY